MALLGVLALGPMASAQEYDDEDDRKVVFRLQGGAFSPMRELDAFEQVDFDDGWNAGASLGFQFNRNVALRFNVDLARAEMRDRRTAATLPLGARNLNGTEFNRWFYDADLQFRYPFDSGFAPYFFVGGGAVTIQRDADRDLDLLDEDDAENFTKAAGKAGIGLAYRFPNTGFELFVQGTGWLYDWDRMGFNRKQVDTTWSGGLGFRF
jgi:hypothetical protein